ncbi:hypothetical protein H7347_10555, partial [Corynebacterium sp. zg-331]|uniref:hypothetical protein n=1 Tax=unclassified Corynebacterium TaxID=2624378 RepID=UPI0019BA6BB1
EPQSADIQLKKYIGGKSEVASVEAAEGLKDSQTEAEAYKASAEGEDLTVAFVVKNTGKVALKDIATPSDAAITAAFTNALDSTVSGVDGSTPQVGNIRVAGFAGNAEKQALLKPGEKVVFVGDLKAPAAGSLHADKAKSAGTPVDDEGREVPFVDKDGREQPEGTSVESNEDQAHAITP